MKLRFTVFIGLFFLVLSLKAQEIKGSYAIKNAETGLVLRIKDAQKANGTPLVAYNHVNWKCVTWDFQKVGEQTYQLENLFTGKTFQFEGETLKPDISLEQQPLVKSAAQNYEFILSGTDTYFIKLSGTELYVTPGEPIGKVNSPIILAEKMKEGNLQKWSIHEQHPTM